MFSGEYQVGLGYFKKPLGRRLPTRDTLDLLAQLHKALRDQSVEDLVLAGVVLIQSRRTIFDTLCDLTDREGLKAVFGNDREGCIKHRLGRFGFSPLTRSVPLQHFRIPFFFRTLYANSIALL